MIFQPTHSGLKPQPVRPNRGGHLGMLGDTIWDPAVRGPIKKGKVERGLGLDPSIVCAIGQPNGGLVVLIRP